MPRILLVDDDTQIRNVFRQILEHAGYEVEIAQDGKAALKCFMDYPADLVITDVVMPEKDGLELVMELRRTSPATKLLVISGGGRLNPFSYLVMAKQLGADAVLAKPISSETLLQTIGTLLDTKQTPKKDSEPPSKDSHHAESTHPDNR